MTKSERDHRKAIRAAPKKACRHCDRQAARLRSRGLCWKCYSVVFVRNQYPAHGAHISKGGEPTDEQLDAIIAEGYRNLPAWWNNSRPHDDFIHGD